MNKEINELLEKINKGLAELDLPDNPSNLYDPISYILQLGGKRVRPILALLAYRLYKQEPKKAIAPILALEVFHNFTLVHDDIMDEAPLRRGQDTVHTKWDRNIAILSGDVMMVNAYELLSYAPEHLLPILLKKFNACAKEVCEGQQKDMDFEKLPSVTVEEYLDMIRQKTAVLLGFSLEMGGILAGAPKADSDRLYEVGINLGLAFQLQDDLLDLYGGDSFGKRIGGDVINKKKSILITKAIELSAQKNELTNIYNTSVNECHEKVKIITAEFKKLQVEKEVKSMIGNLEQKGNDKLMQLNSCNLETIIKYIGQLKSRNK